MVNKTGDLIAGFIVLLISIVAFYASLDIRSFGNDPIGPKTLPQTVSIILGMLALGLIVQSSRLPAGDPSVSHSVQWKDLQPAALVTLSFLLYGIVVNIIGYMFSTAIIMFFLLSIFRNTGVIRLFLYSILSGIFFQIIFVKFMGTYVPTSMVMRFIKSLAG